LKSARAVSNKIISYPACIRVFQIFMILHLMMFSSIIFQSITFTIVYNHLLHVLLSNLYLIVDF